MVPKRSPRGFVPLLFVKMPEDKKVEVCLADICLIGENVDIGGREARAVIKGSLIKTAHRAQW